MKRPVFMFVGNRRGSGTTYKFITSCWTARGSNPDERRVFSVLSIATRGPSVKWVPGASNTRTLLCTKKYHYMFRYKKQSSGEEGATKYCVRNA
jgi:hypothetical protein